MSPIQVRDTLEWELDQTEINFTFVPVITGQFLEVFFSGVCFAAYTQYVHSDHWRSDSLFNRIYVSFVVLLTLASVTLTTYTNVGNAANQRRDSQWFDSPSEGLVVGGIMWSVVVITTQCFLARRAYLITTRISKRWSIVLLAFLMLMCLAALTSFISTIAVGNSMQPYTGRHIAALTDPNAPWMEQNGLALGLAFSAANDVLISSTLGWHWMRLLRDNEGLSHRTDSLLRKLIGFTLSTALFTTIPAVVCAILRFTEASNPRHPIMNVVFLGILCPLYPLSLLTTLNFRTILRSTNAFRPSAVEIRTIVVSKSTPTGHELAERPDDDNSRQVSKGASRPASLEVTLGKSVAMVRSMKTTQDQAIDINPSVAVERYPNVVP